MNAVAEDASGTFGEPDQAGPTRSSRAIAIVHAAVFDAVNSIDQSYRPYLILRRQPLASVDAAVAAAAHHTLRSLYPRQAEAFDEAFESYVAAIPESTAKDSGIELGWLVADTLLVERESDGFDAPATYTPITAPGHHRPDPRAPEQGFLTPGWGNVVPFAVASADMFPVPHPPPLGSLSYAFSFLEVASLGGDGVTTPTTRTPEQTEIGIYWAYDGSRGLGTPVRLYNQIARVIAVQKGNTEVENARLFALVNLALADAGIVGWRKKYEVDFWRPIIGVRRANTDGNPLTARDSSWTPLGAPASNGGGINLTPPFPSYVSGHAILGGTLFRTLARFFDTDRVPFCFMSDELNGVTTDGEGNVRPAVTRCFATLSEASRENAQSRIYLGVHWHFDAVYGRRQGRQIADYVFEHSLQPW